MSYPVREASGLARLRERASEQLGVNQPTAEKPAGQAEALAVLYQLASSPATAMDAVALLHELQVHQVELDLQLEELRCSQSELETALGRQAALVERAPVGYMTIDSGTVLSEINAAGERLLGAARIHLLGRPLASLLTVRSIDTLQTLLERTREGRETETCELQLTPVSGMSCTVLATAARDVVPERFLLALMSAHSR